MASIDPGLQITMQSGTLGSSNTVRLEITNLEEVLKVLKDLDSKYIFALRKEFKKVGKTAANSVRKSIPNKSKPPLTHMRQVWFGRLAWGTNYGGSGSKPRPAQSVLVQTPNTRKKKYRELERVPVVRLQIGSPGTVLFDMAGRLMNAKGRKGKTPIYDYMYTIGGQKVPGKRQHTVVPGAFSKGITKSGYGRASRIVYPAVEKAMPRVTDDMRQVIRVVNRDIQTLLNAKAKQGER